MKNSRRVWKNRLRPEHRRLKAGPRILTLLYKKWKTEDGGGNGELISRGMIILELCFSKVYLARC